VATKSRTRRRNHGAPNQVLDPRAERDQAGDGGILLEFRHGLGDLIQLSIVLQHLRAVNPNAAIDVVCADEKVLSHSGFERQRFGFHCPRYKQGGWDQVISLDFGDFGGDVAGFPNTKPLRALAEVLQLEPRLDLFCYALIVREHAKQAAAGYLRGICNADPDEAGRFPIVMIHYQGCSSRMHKDLPHEVVETLSTACRRRGRTVAILDLERLSPVVNQSTVFSPLNGHPVWQEPGIADPETMAGMIAQVELFIGIDSGPLHIAGALDTPSLGVWTHHHPIRFFDIAPNVLHLVPSGHRRFAGGPRAVDTFEELYRHVVYGNLQGAILEEMDRLLSGDRPTTKPSSAALPGLNATSYGEQYYTEHVLAGLDYLGHGDWQREYGAWLADVFGWRGKRVLEVGCACGSVMRGLGHVGVVVQGIDVSEFMIDRGRRKWPDMAKLMHVADAVNLHMFSDGQWDGLHSAQVAEHWKPALAPFILAELARVTAAGGLFFLCLDTVELFERNGRTMDKEDKTHICVRPRAWWSELFGPAGWIDATDEFRGELENHAASFLKRYDWDFFVLKRAPIQEG
jgi:SAM-dependent methyltransferase